jgi:hypothetical protein
MRIPFANLRADRDVVLEQNRNPMQRTTNVSVEAFMVVLRPPKQIVKEVK